MNEATNYLAQNQKLFEVSVAEFGEKAYHFASLNDIVKKAEFNKGSFYYRFSDKLMLYFATIDLVNVEHLEIYNNLLLLLKNKTSFLDLTLVLFQSIRDLEQKSHVFAQLIRTHHLFNQSVNKNLPPEITPFVFERYLEQVKDFKQSPLLKVVELLYFSPFLAQLSLEEVKDLLLRKNVSHLNLSTISTDSKTSITSDAIYDSITQIKNHVLILGKTRSGKTTLAKTMLQKSKTNQSSVYLINDQFRINKAWAPKNQQITTHVDFDLKSILPDTHAMTQRYRTTLLRIFKNPPSYIIFDNSFSTISSSLSSLIFDCLLKNLPKTCKMIMIVTNIPFIVHDSFDLFIYRDFQFASIEDLFKNQAISNTIVMSYLSQGIDFMEVKSKDYLKSEEFLKNMTHIELKKISPANESMDLIYQYKTGDVLE